MAAWQKLVQEKPEDGLESLPLPSRLVTEEDLKLFYQAMKIYETQSVGLKRKGDIGGLDTQQYGRGKRAREVRSYEDQWTEEEFEKLCQVDSPESSQLVAVDLNYSGSPSVSNSELQLPKDPSPQPKELVKPCKEGQLPAKRGRGRPKRAVIENSESSVGPTLSGTVSTIAGPNSTTATEPSGSTKCDIIGTTASLSSLGPAMPLQGKDRRVPKAHMGGTARGRGRKQKSITSNASAEPDTTGGPTERSAAPNKSELTLSSSELNVGRTSRIPPPLSVTSHASQMSGSSRGTDLAAICSSKSSHSQDKLKHDFPGIDMQEAVPAYETKTASIGAQDMPGNMCFSQPTASDAVKSGIVQIGPGQNFRACVPAVPVLIQGSTESRNHDMISSDAVCNNMQRPAKEEKSPQCNQKKGSTSDSNLAENQIPATEKNDTSLPNAQRTLNGKSNEKQNPADKLSLSSIQTSEPIINTQSSELEKTTDKVGGPSFPSNLTDVSGCDAAKASLSMSIHVDKTTHDITRNIQSVEGIKCQENVIQHKTPGLAHQSKYTEALVVGPSGQGPLPPMKDYSTPAVLVHREPENKSSVTRKKAAVREPRKSSSSTTAACERRARRTGLKQADGLKMDRKRELQQAVTISSKQESDCVGAVTVASGIARNLEEKYTKIQAHVALPMPMGISNEKSPLHLNELKPNVTQFSQTKIEGGAIADQSPSTKVALPDSSSEAKNNIGQPCNMEDSVNTVGEHHSLEHLKSGCPSLALVSSTNCRAAVKSTGTSEGKSMQPSCAESVNYSVEKIEKLDTFTTKEEAAPVLRKDGDVTSKELVSLHGNITSLAEGVEVNNSSVEGPIHPSSGAIMVSTDENPKDDECSVPAVSKIVDFHGSTVSFSERKEAPNSFTENPAVFTDSDGFSERGGAIECSQNLSMEIIEDSQQNDRINLSVGCCSVPSVLEVNSTTEKIALSASEERMVPHQTITDRPSVTNMVDVTSSNVDPSTLVSQDTQSQTTHALAPICVASATTSTTKTTDTKKDGSPGESIPLNPSLAVSTETNATKEDVLSSKEIVSPAEISISEHGRNPSDMIVEILDNSGDRYSVRDAANTADVTEFSTLNCQALAAASPGEGVCREQENFHATGGVAEINTDSDALVAAPPGRTVGEATELKREEQKDLHENDDEVETGSSPCLLPQCPKEIDDSDGGSLGTSSIFSVPPTSHNLLQEEQLKQMMQANSSSFYNCSGTSVTAERADNCTMGNVDIPDNKLNTYMVSMDAASREDPVSGVHPEECKNSAGMTYQFGKTDAGLEPHAVNPSVLGSDLSVRSSKISVEAESDGNLHIDNSAPESAQAISAGSLEQLPEAFDKPHN